MVILTSGTAARILVVASFGERAAHCAARQRSTGDLSCLVFSYLVVGGSRTSINKRLFTERTSARRDGRVGGPWEKSAGPPRRGIPSFSARRAGSEVKRAEARADGIPPTQHRYSRDTTSANLTFPRPRARCPAGEIVRGLTRWPLFEYAGEPA